jgi:hypothetical protein
MQPEQGDMTSARVRVAWTVVIAFVMLFGYAVDLKHRSDVARLESVPLSPASLQLAALTKEPDTLIRAFGAPDYDQSTIEPDSTITRAVTYAVEYVQVVYRTDGPGATPAASQRWTRIGFRDPTNNAPLDPNEALSRLAARRR